jgi:hypothetical protein
VRLAKPILGGLACLLAVGLLGSGSARATPVISGINGASLFGAPAVMWDPQLAAIQAQGVTTVRSDAPWGQIEPLAPGPLGPVFQFTNIDTWVLDLALNHIRWQPILDYGTSWGNPITNYPAFQAYVQAVAARYGAGGSFWAANPTVPYLPVQIFELWNEENGTQWPINAHDYGALYLAVHSAIHSVDPSASLDVGGLGGLPKNFRASQDAASWYLVYLFKYFPQLKTTIDGYALHPYGKTALDTAYWIASFRHTLDHFRIPASVPIDITEFGWPLGPFPESYRASQMDTLGKFLPNSDCGIREIAPYDWINPAISNEGFDFGFVDQTGVDTALRPAGSAWFNALRQASAQPKKDLCAATKPKPKKHKKKKKKKKKKKHPGHGGKHHPKPGHH